MKAYLQIKILKNNYSLAVLVVAMFVLASWGRTGHFNVNENAVLSFTNGIEQFAYWKSGLADHASDADARKSQDPDESKRHYIDIDNYPEFVANGSINEDYNALVSKHSEAFVLEQGVLPWATHDCYLRLVQNFKNRAWDSAMLTAADLGHYVADGHNPLHVTRNYNGQETGNYGIHSRYESKMLDRYISEITFSAKQVFKIDDVKHYIFEYLYLSNSYVDSLIEADNYATQKAGNTSSDTYYSNLWEKTAYLTKKQLNSASFILANLIYNAWITAGSPQINPSSVAAVQQNIIKVHLQSPFHDKTVYLNDFEPDKQLNIAVYSLQGKLLGSKTRHGNEELSFSALSPGIYLLRFETESKAKVLKIYLN